MAIGELARLERFRRASAVLGLSEAPAGLSSVKEMAHLRGRINAQLYPQYKEWMLPSWAILTLRDMEKEALLESLENRSYRNWSLIGGVGGTRYGIADSRGLTIGRPECGSIDIWVSKDEDILFPALEDKDGTQLNLVSTDDQIYQWKTDSGSVEYTRLVYHVERAGVEYLYNELNLKNLGLEEANARFYVAIRPMSLLGFEPIDSIRYDASDSRILINRETAIQFDKAPTSIMMTKANDADLIRKIRSDVDRIDEEIEDEAGLAQCILRYDVQLPAAGSSRIFFTSPFRRTAEAKEDPSGNPQQSDRDLHVASWFDFVDQRVSAQFPDSTLDLAFSQAAASIAIQSQSVMFPDESDMAQINWKDRIRVLLALAKMGSTSLVSQIAQALISRSGAPRGKLELTVFSPILWGLLQVEAHQLAGYNPKGRSEFIERLTEGVIASLSSVPSVHNSPEDDSLLQHYNMIVPGVFRELEDTLWTLAALQAAERYAAAHSGADRIRIVAGSVNTLRKQAESQIEEIRASRWPRPSDEDMEFIDREILDLLATFSQMDLDLNQDFFADLCKKIESRRIVKGLWKQTSPQELYSGHLSLRLAQYYAKTCQRDRVWPLLERVLDFLSVDYLLPEYVNTKTYGGSAGAGSSILAAVDFILLVRAMLLHEAHDHLVLLPGIPEQWYFDKKPLLLNDLPTQFGLVAIEIGTSANQHQIEISSTNLPEEIEVHVPSSVPMRMVKAFGSSIVERAIKTTSPHLKIVPLADSAVLTFHK